MNTALWILLVIAAIIISLLLLALFMKKEYNIEREVIISRPNEEVFNYLKFLKNQENFSKWVMQDPSMRKQFKGTDGQPGFIYAWDSDDKNAGKGEQEIRNITEGKKIGIEVRFEKPFVGKAYTPFTTEKISDQQTKVIWGMEGKNNWPMNLMHLFMLNMLKKDMQISLGNLKNVLENSHQSRSAAADGQAQS